MTRPKDPISVLVDELAGVLERLCKIQSLVNTAVREKLDAMRRAEVVEITARAHREGELAAQTAELDKSRRDVVARLCKALGISAVEEGREISLRSLVRRLAPPHRDRLAALANDLRERMIKTAESNRVVEIVCHEMMTHFKAVFEAMTSVAAESGVYGARGRRAHSGEPLALDAVG